jgi:hypothetical protein
MLDGQRITDFTTFVEPALIPRFGLPDEIEPEEKLTTP